MEGINRVVYDVTSKPPGHDRAAPRVSYLLGRIFQLTDGRDHFGQVLVDVMAFMHVRRSVAAPGRNGSIRAHSSSVKSVG
jgi:hypothetical protein